MGLPLLLFKQVARAYLNSLGGGPLGDIAISIAEEVIDGWHARADEQARKAEIEAIAQAAAEQVRLAVHQAVESIAADRLEADRRALAAYLAQIPAAIRCNLRRASDPAGRTVPSGFRIRDARGLAAILPDRPPRFSPGDRPWPDGRR